VASAATTTATRTGPISKKDIPAEDRVIIHFSTDCTAFQHWQAMTMLESAERVGQRGAIVRVVCGCEQSASLTGDDQLTQEQIKAEHAAFAEHPTVAPRFRFHLLFIDDMMGIANNTVRYKFANKAQSLHYWLDKMGGGTLRDVVGPGVELDEEEEEEEEEEDDVAIVSIDPDFLFLTPFGPRELGLLTAEEMEEDTQNDGSSRSSSSSGREVISRMRGRPIAQAYGLDSAWLRFPVCKEDTEGCALVTPAEAVQYYNVGPPYALHRADWFPFIDAWTSIIPLTYAQYLLVSGPDQDPTRHYAEMFAWAIAAAKLHLPHTLLQREMAGCMVGWPGKVMVAALNEGRKKEEREELRCGLDSVIGHRSGDSGEASPKLPAFLHYCQQQRIRGEAREWWWYKRMLPADLIFDCGPHLVELPPAGSFGDGGSDDGFISCTLIEIVNACKRRFRRSSACRASGEVEEEEEEEERNDVRIIPGGGTRRIREGGWRDVEPE
jgi:hypothetical protein